MPGEAIMNNEDAVRNEWGQICSQLRTEVGEKAFDSWLKPLSVGSFANGIMNICVPTRFMRNWVITNYSDRIHKIWEKKNPAIKSINFVVQATEDPAVGMHNSSCRSLLKKLPPVRRRRPFTSREPDRPPPSRPNTPLSENPDNLCRCRSTRNTPLTISWSAKPTNLLMPRRAKWRNPTTFPLTRCFCIPASVWAKPI